MLAPVPRTLLTATSRGIANVMVTILAFIVLGGGTYAAFNLPRNSVRSKNIVNGQVKKQDLAKPPNPVAFARISAAGNVQSSTGMPNATVTNPQQGVYCLRNLDFAFNGAQVTADFDDSSGQIATQFGRTVPSTCSPQANAYVATVGSDDQGHNAGFYIAFTTKPAKGQRLRGCLRPGRKQTPNPRASPIVGAA